MTIYNDTISSYIGGLFVHEDTALQTAMHDSPRQGLPAISVKAEEGRFLQVLASSAGCGGQAAKAVEIGTLGGYSGIWIARGLPPGSKLITLEKEPRHAAVARQHFDLAGVGGQVEIRVGNAHETLKTLAAEGPFDFIFIDAEKSGYVAYFEWALENVRLGGIIAAHNAFRKGSVAGIGPADEYTADTVAFNQRVAAEPRVRSTIFPAGDGTLVAVRIA
jgi:predicted O-methyltransferase YrrM